MLIQFVCVPVHTYTCLFAHMWHFRVWLLLGAWRGAMRIKSIYLVIPHAVRYPSINAGNQYDVGVSDTSPQGHAQSWSLAPLGPTRTSQRHTGTRAGVAPAQHCPAATARRALPLLHCLFFSN